MESKEKLTVYIRKSLKENVVSYCKNNGYSASEFVAIAINKELERRERR